MTGNRIAATRRRKIMSGFPQETPFNTVEEARAYLDEPRITCLRCGKTYKGLVTHLKLIHDWTLDQYREFYHLPYRKGLICPSTAARFSQHHKNKVEREMLERVTRGEAPWTQLIEAQKGQRRTARHGIFSRAVSRQNMLGAVTHNAEAIASGQFKTWKPEDYDRVLERMRKGDLSPREACIGSDMPSLQSFHTHREQDSEFSKRYEAAWESLSFSAQSKAKRLGKRFGRECRALYGQQMSVKAIAETLGVTQLSVRRHISGNRNGHMV